MAEENIENLQEVLSTRLGNDKKISDVHITRLTAPGENFGSIMLKLDIKLKNADGTQEEIHAVAKKLPTGEFQRKVFNVQVTVKNEIAMYDTIVPTLQEFQREHGVKDVVDYLPKLYGARISLDANAVDVDDNAVLILENLKESGYINVDRHVGFDLETAELILKDIAAFHAVPIALKLAKPEVFDKKIRPYLTPFMPPDMPENGENGGSFESAMLEILQDSYKCIPYITKIKAILGHEKEFKKLPPREPFATVVHGDMWVNNTMVKFENGKPVKNKLVDFQVCDYRSPASDLLFFLFTSIQRRVLVDSFDDLIKFYHNHFISHLEKLGCDVRPFGFHDFLEELKLTTPSELQHTLMMTLFIVFGKKGGPSRELGPDNPPDFAKARENLSLDAKEKVWLMVELCGKKGWL